MYVAGVVTVLANYPPEVMARVVHPVTGLPGTTKYLPAIAEVKEACEAAKRLLETEREVRARLGPPIDKEAQRRASRQPGPPRNRANLFCAANLPYYAAFVERAKRADPLDFRHGVGPDGLTHGIWVVAEWHHGAAQSSIFAPAVQMAAEAKRLSRQYEEMGLEPVYCGDTIVSPALADYAASVRGMDRSHEVTEAEEWA